MSISCYDVARMAIDGLDYEVTNGYTLNKWKERIFRRACALIDGAADALSASGYAVGLDEITGHIYISIQCPPVSTGNDNEAFYSAVKAAQSVGFSRGSGNSVMVNFELDGIWSKVGE